MSGRQTGTGWDAIELAQKSNSQVSEPRSATLAELLTRFKLKRPLYVDEASALCYQLLDQLKQHVLEGSMPRIEVHCLLFPTLANIIVTENGLAFTRPSKTDRTESAYDWLSAFAQTLKNHTLLTKSDESSIFEWLIQEFLVHPNHYDELHRKIPIWQATCLQLCTNEEATMNSKPMGKLLQNFHIRSRQSRNGQLIQRELVALRRQCISPGLKECVHLTKSKENVGLLSGWLVSSRDAEDREAFRTWTEKWRCVNLEYANRKARTKHHSTQPSACSSPECLQQTPAYVSRTCSLSKMDRNPLCAHNSQSNQRPTFPHTDTLKQFYSSIIGKPIGLLRKGLKEVREHILASHQHLPGDQKNSPGLLPGNKSRTYSQSAGNRNSPNSRHCT